MSDEQSNSNGKDTAFKNDVQVKGYKEYNISNLTTDIWDYYQPDKIFTSINNKMEFIVMESSSTGDRKVHIGELLQFLTFVSSKDIYIEKATYILFLCGKGKSSPTVNGEYNRLKYYFDNYPIKPEVLKKIKGIYITDTKDYSSLDISKINNMKNVLK